MESKSMYCMICGGVTPCETHIFHVEAGRWGPLSADSEGAAKPPSKSLQNLLEQASFDAAVAADLIRRRSVTNKYEYNKYKYNAASQETLDSYNQAVVEGRVWLPLCLHPEEVDDGSAAHEPLTPLSSYQSPLHLNTLAQQNLWLQNQAGSAVYEPAKPIACGRSSFVARAAHERAEAFRARAVPRSLVEDGVVTKEELDALGWCYTVAGDAWAPACVEDAPERGPDDPVKDDIDKVLDHVLNGRAKAHHDVLRRTMDQAERVKPGADDALRNISGRRR